MAAGELAPMFRALERLEQDVSAAAAAANADDEMRVYLFRPRRYPELPAIWNWVDDGSVEVPDTARQDDVIIVTASVGVAVTGEPDEDLSRLVVLVDHFRRVVDPALKNRPVLADEDGMATARAARRILTRTEGYEWDDGPVLAMDMLIRVDLARIVN